MKVSGKLSMLNPDHHGSFLKRALNYCLFGEDFRCWGHLHMQLWKVCRLFCLKSFSANEREKSIGCPIFTYESLNLLHASSVFWSIPVTSGFKIQVQFLCITLLLVHFSAQPHPSPIVFHSNFLVVGRACFTSHSQAAGHGKLQKDGFLTLHFKERISKKWWKAACCGVRKIVQKTIRVFTSVLSHLRMCLYIFICVLSLCNVIVYEYIQVFCCT